jgi:GrpB-like predicted nucleotidyltransferase (UPF0157 family)
MIIIKDYDKNWPKLYELEKNIMLISIGKWVKAIEHVGSTSIPGLSAKPTIDICIGVKFLTQADKYLLTPLQQFGYEYIQALETDIPERRYLQKLNNKGEHLFHIHIVVFGSRLWKEYIGFRDYFITHPDKLKDYADLKCKLKEQFYSDRESYTVGKSDFIKKILAHVMKENYTENKIIGKK